MLSLIPDIVLPTPYEVRAMISRCCTEPKPDYKAELTPEEFSKFCYLVHTFKKKGYTLEDAQTRAYSTVLVESIEG